MLDATLIEAIGALVTTLGLPSVLVLAVGYSLLQNKNQGNNKMEDAVEDIDKRLTVVETLVSVMRASK